MAFQVERIKHLTCSQCGHGFDAAPLQPLSTTACPDCGAKTQVPAQFGQYVLIAKVGRGAAGTVFRAFDESLHRQVAIKIVRSDGDQDSVRAQKCLDEARALARLNHPNIVQIYDVGTFRDQPYLVMELLSDQSYLRHTSPANLLSERHVMTAGLMVAQGLDAAGRIGLVHMDVKPQNIAMNRDGRLKLIDFGAARLEHGETKTKIHGTPMYVAPEIVRGQLPDIRSDMYSLGATLFHLLTGRPVFIGVRTRDVLAARLREPAPPLNRYRQDVSEQTCRVVARLLETDPWHRYDNYEALIEDLNEAVAHAAHEAPQLVSCRDTCPIPYIPAMAQSTLGNLAEALGTVDPELPQTRSITSTLTATSSRRRRANSRWLMSIIGLGIMAITLGAVTRGFGNRSDRMIELPQDFAPTDAAPQPLLNESDPEKSPTDFVELQLDLLAHWTMENRIQSEVGGHRLIPKGATGYAPSQHGLALRLPAGSWVQSPARPSLQLNKGNASIAMWIHTEVIKQDHRPLLFKKGAYGLFLGRDGDQIHLLGKIKTETETAAANAKIATPLDGRWHHVACVWTHEHIQVYYDGKQVGTNPHALSIPSDLKAPILMGSFHGEDWSAYQGMIDDVRLYDRALNADEIQELARR